MILAIQDTAMISFLVEAMQRKVNKNDKPKYSNNHLSCCDKLVTRTLRIHVYLWTKLYFCKARGRARIDCNMFRSDFVFHCPPHKILTCVEVDHAFLVFIIAEREL